MDVSLDLWTDGASLLIFDAAMYESSGPAPYTFQENKDVQQGRYTMVRLQGDGTFRLRLTDDKLTARERELLNETLGPLGLEIRSGRAYVSGMDMPGEPTEIYEKHGAGGFVALEPGEYNLLVHELDLEAVGEDERKELPDFVVELQSRLEPFLGVFMEPQFTGGRAMERILTNLTSKTEAAQ